MKIAFTCNNLNNGGAERVICNLANQMVKDGIEVHIICYAILPTFYFQLDDRIKIIQLDKKITKRKSFIFRKIAGIINFIKLILNLKWADKVVSFYTRQNCYSIIACKILKKSIICAERDHFFLNDGKLNHKLRLKLYPKASGFIHQTIMAQQWLRKKEGVKCKDIVIPNPLWIKEFPERSPISGNIIAVGRLDEQKNYEGIISAFEIVHKKNSKAKLSIYGEGPLKEKIQKLIIDKKLEKVVFLKGISKDIVTIYKNADIFVMFSHGEGYPNALMEALAIGVPSISSDCPVGGPRDMITDGINGYLVPCSNIEFLAKRILELLENEDLKNMFAKNAINIRETNNFDVIYKKYIEFIKFVDNI